MIGIIGDIIKISNKEYQNSLNSLISKIPSIYLNLV
jgi:hypothetical protein